MRGEFDDHDVLALLDFVQKRTWVVALDKAYMILFGDAIGEGVANFVRGEEYASKSVDRCRFR